LEQHTEKKPALHFPQLDSIRVFRNPDCPTFKLSDDHNTSDSRSISGNSVVIRL